MPYEIVVPVKEYVREYLLAQHGTKPILLPETNVLSVLLRDSSDKKKFNVFQFNPFLYCERVSLLSEISIPQIETYQVMKFNHYIELQIKLMVVFRANTSVNNLKEVILDVIAENNFPIEKYSSLKSYILSVKRYANELREAV